ncbi:MAG: hypothetical protein AB2800_20450 [Candidatus Thiodiazotropha endolucinida]
MDKKAFKRRYGRLAKQLESATETLTDELSNCIDSTSNQYLFRPRLIEARVKSPDSLFQRIIMSGGDFSDAFDIEKQEDLIGARIVVHNLSDIRRILDSLERWQSITVLSNPSHEGTWADYEQAIVEGDKESGYRTLHKTVTWNHNNKKYYAELQIRTILKDAWASFMHDDIYEHGIKADLPKDLVLSLKHTSDLLYSLDQMAERLRVSVEKRNAAGVSLKEILQLGLNGLHAWQESNLVAPQYETINREDFYSTEDGDGLYDIIINAKLPIGKKEEFTLPITGDTDAKSSLEELVVTDLTTNTILSLGTELTLTHKSNGNNNKHNIVFLKHKKKRTRHHYRIQCKWKKTFSDNLEYLHIPWSRYYGKPGRYCLELSTDKGFAIAPRLYSVSEAVEVIPKLSEGLDPDDSVGRQGTQEGRNKKKLKWCDDTFNGMYLLAWVFQ